MSIVTSTNTYKLFLFINEYNPQKYIYHRRAKFRRCRCNKNEVSILITIASSVFSQDNKNRKEETDPHFLAELNPLRKGK